MSGHTTLACVLDDSSLTDVVDYDKLLLLLRRCVSADNYPSVTEFFIIKLHCVSKNVPPLTCYNFDVHHLIVIIFGRSVTEKVRNQTMLCFPTSPV